MPSRPRDSRRTSRWLVGGGVAAALLVAMLAVGWGLGWFTRAEDPRVLEIGELMQGMLERERQRQGPGTFLAAVERVAGITSIALKASALPENLRPRVMELGFGVMMQHMGDRADLYFALRTAEERDQFIDQELGQMDFMRRAFETTGKPPDAQGPRGPDGPRGMRGSQDRENRFGKWIIDRTSPEERARLEEFITAIERRRGATGGRRR
jgi:hypothetical protein